MAENPRARKIADRIREITVRALEREVKDPRLGFVTITDVRVTGDLQHASIFYTVNDNLKVGVQGVNLLDQVTRTSQVIDFDGNLVIRSAFRNDRRYTFLARFDF